MPFKCLNNKKKIKTASVLGQTRPNFWQIQEQDCGSLPGPRASPPCDATPLLCSEALWGRPESEHVPAPRTPSCGRPESTADPEPLLTSSWRWRTRSNNTAGSGTMTTGLASMAVAVVETGTGSVKKGKQAIFQFNYTVMPSALLNGAHSSLQGERERGRDVWNRFPVVSWLPK